MQQPTYFIVYSVQSCDTQEPTFGRPQHVLNLRQVGRDGEQRVLNGRFTPQPVFLFHGLRLHWHVLDKLPGA